MRHCTLFKGDADLLTLLRYKAAQCWKALISDILEQRIQMHGSTFALGKGGTILIEESLVKTGMVKIGRKYFSSAPTIQRLHHVVQNVISQTVYHIWLESTNTRRFGSKHSRTW